MKYAPYKPTKWEARIDKLLGLASTKVALKRMVNRERMNWFRYLAAQPTSARPNSNAQTAGEWLRIQREKMQVMWNAIDMVDNSGLCSGILTKFPTYVCGTLRWQARTGDKDINNTYQQYIQYKTGKPANIDLKGIASLRQQCILDIKSIMLKGDVATNIVRDSDDELYLQGIEANRIGDPYRWETSDTYVRGLTIDPVTGRIKSARVYHQDRRSGIYKFDAEFPTTDERGLPKFLFFTNPIDYDNYRGVSLFKHAIDNSTYIDRMRQYELQALLWASSQSGVYYTKSGTLPEALPFSRTPVVDKDGNTIDTFETRPNTLVALSADGERVEMFQHDRPSPNVIGMYENTIIDISVGAGLTKQFTWGLTGTGPEVRMASAQDARTIQIWQEMLRESKLDNVILLILGDAIAKGILPYHENWLLWDWYFPAKPTIDVGRESDADIAEIQAGINTGANVTAETGQGDIEDVIVQRGHEVGMMIDAAMDEAEQRGLEWEQVYAMMFPQKGKAGGGGGGANPFAPNAGMAAGMVRGFNPDKAGATDDGIDIDGGGGNGSGRFSHERELIELLKDAKERQEFYSPMQARDEGGRWVDEGKGSQEPGYKPPGEAELTGIDKRLVDYVVGRPLERKAGDVRGIREYAPDMHYTPYSKTAFFDRLNVMQGTPNPTEMPIEQFANARRDLFQRFPEKMIPIKDLIATQPVVNNSKIEKSIEREKETGQKKHTPAFVVQYRGRNYVMDGHHGVMAAAKQGEKEVRANVIRFTDGDKHRITSHDIESYRGKVDSGQLSQHKDQLDPVFKMDVPETKVVPIKSLVSTKNELDDPKFVGGLKGDPRQTASDRMVHSIRTGVSPDKKREPLDVKDNGDGTYTIIDGNATAQAAMLAGWTKLPVVVASKEENKALAWAENVKPKLDNTVREIAFANGARYLPAPLKTRSEARKKVNGKYNGDWSRITDLARTRIGTFGSGQTHAVVAELSKRFGMEPEVNLPQAKGGYSDFKFNPVINGRKVEISVTPNYVHEAALKVHDVYDKKRKLEYKANLERRSLTPEEQAQKAEYLKTMEKAFMEAAEKAGFA